MLDGFRAPAEGGADARAGDPQLGASSDLASFDQPVGRQPFDRPVGERSTQGPDPADVTVGREQLDDRPAVDRTLRDEREADLIGEWQWWLRHDRSVGAIRELVRIVTSVQPDARIPQRHVGVDGVRVLAPRVRIVGRPTRRVRRVLADRHVRSDRGRFRGGESGRRRGDQLRRLVIARRAARRWCTCGRTGHRQPGADGPGTRRTVGAGRTGGVRRATRW